MMRTLPSVSLLCSLALVANGCSGRSTLPSGSVSTESSLPVTKAAAHARGMWLTQELPAVKIIPVAASAPRHIDNVPVPPPGGWRPPAGYSGVTRTAGSTKPWYSPSQLASDANYVTYRGVFTGTNQYQLRVDYSDGTSAIAVGIANQPNELAVIHPDGSASVIALNTTAGNGGTVTLVQDHLSAQPFINAQPQKLSTFTCSLITAGGGFIGGLFAEGVVDLLSDGIGTSLSPWVWRIGAAGGTAFTAYFLNVSGSC